MIGGLRRQTSTLKPFNPILGETYQAQYSSGVRVYAEQISHHPPVSSWQVEDAQGRVRLSHDSVPHRTCMYSSTELVGQLQTCLVQVSRTLVGRARSHLQCAPKAKM